MSTRRDFLKHTTAAGLVAATSLPIARAAPHKSVPRIKAMIRREDTVLRYGGDGDNFHMSWASDDRQYMSLCDGGGFADPPTVSYNSRMFAIEGGPREAKFHDLPGYPMLGKPMQNPKDPRYYNYGTLALDGHLYQFLSTYNRRLTPEDFEHPKDRVRYNGAKLIYSADSGRNWHNQNGSTPVAWEDWNSRSRDTMVFFNEDQDAFALLTVLQMGKNYEHNRDGYLYVYAPNGSAEGTMNELVMFRVSKDKLLDRNRYEYFAGRGAIGGARWTPDIRSRAVVHTFPRGWVNKLIHPYAWHPSVVYNAPLGVYMMANFGMGTAPNGLWFGKPSYLGLWTSPNPWGPWTQIHEETAWLPAGDKNARAYEPQIAPKWIAQDGKSFWLVWTDYQVTDETAWNRALADVQGNGLSAEATAMLVRKRREYMPYYKFNAQRVDLVVT